jgi:glycosyltransferase involved in cell wall biosynthesis
MTSEYSPPRDPSAASLDLTIVVPAFNEEGRIVATLEELRAYLSSRAWRWDVVVVDDGSTDGTVRAVEEAARTDGRVRVQREPHRGKGGAVRAGLLASNAAHRFICDADLSMPVHELERFMPPALGTADVAIGSREGAGARRVGEPLFRHVTGRVFNRLVQRLAVPGIEDTQCGFKMFTARAVETVFPLDESMSRRSTTPAIARITTRSPHRSRRPAHMRSRINSAISRAPSVFARSGGRAADESLSSASRQRPARSAS